MAKNIPLTFKGPLLLLVPSMHFQSQSRQCPVRATRYKHGFYNRYTILLCSSHAVFTRFLRKYLIFMVFPGRERGYCWPYFFDQPIFLKKEKKWLNNSQKKEKMKILNFFHEKSFHLSVSFTFLSAFTIICCIFTSSSRQQRK